jgi:hypothetical protein
MYPSNINNGTIVDTVNNSLFNLSRRIDFIGYGVVDPQNIINYQDITLCPEGQVYNLQTLQCIGKLNLILSSCFYQMSNFR